MKNLLIFCLVSLRVLVVAQTAGYKVGDQAADFKLVNVDNKIVSLSDYQGAKGYVVVFTCNTCPVAQAYEERIKALHSKYSSLSYPVVAINTNDPVTQPGDSFDKMQARAKEKGFDFAYLSDPDHVITKKYGANRTPHIFILQKNGNVNTVEYIGAIDDDTENSNPDKTKYAENALDALLAGKKPAVTFTKAVGCTIKWKKGMSL